MVASARAGLTGGVAQFGRVRYQVEFSDPAPGHGEAEYRERVRQSAEQQAGHAVDQDWLSLRDEPRRGPQNIAGDSPGADLSRQRFPAWSEIEAENHVRGQHIQERLEVPVTRGGQERVHRPTVRRSVAVRLRRTAYPAAGAAG